MIRSHFRTNNPIPKRLLLLLVDQSCWMEKPMGSSSTRKMDELAEVVNLLLRNIVLRCTRQDGVRDIWDIGVFGYATDSEANPIVASAFNSALQAVADLDGLVTIVQVAEHAEVEDRALQICDEETGEPIEVPVKFPVWIKAKAEGGAPMCYALSRAIDVLDAWIANHPSSPPPIVINFTNGETTDGGNPVEYADALKHRNTDEGNVLLMNFHVAPVTVESVMFPSSSDLFTDCFAKTLFAMSSELLEIQPEQLVANGQGVEAGARALAIGTQPDSLHCFVHVLVELLLFPTHLQRLDPR